MSSVEYDIPKNFGNVHFSEEDNASLEEFGEALSRYFSSEE